MSRFNKGTACLRRLLQYSCAIIARGLSRKIQFAFALLLLGLLSTATQSSFAQSTPPLQFGNNFFVTGDYVVGGVGLRGLGDSTGYATGTINIPDQSPNWYMSGARSVPPGAQIIAAVLYWQTVESSATLNIGANGFFRPVFTGGPTTGYAITGKSLGNPNAPPVAWSSGGCSGNSNGTKIIQAYRADVTPLIQQDANGNLYSSYEVRLPDSGSNGGGVPLTLGATLVIIYRVLSPNIPLNSIVIYDGAFSPSTNSSAMSQTVQGFYEPAGTSAARLTHIVGNGQPNKYEQVSFGNTTLYPLNALGTAAFPGLYNQNTISLSGGGSWDNATWDVSQYVNTADTSETTTVVPNQNNQGCVTWGAVIVGTRVQSSDNDGLLDVWKKAQGYCDAAVKEGKCQPGDPSWVSLPGAAIPGNGFKDIFVQVDYMCSLLNTSTGSCDTTNGNYSFQPLPGALTMMTNAFSAKNINLHIIPTNAIQEQTCADVSSPLQLCVFPNQPGVVGWKGGLAFLKNQLIYPNGTVCTDSTNTTCNPRFQHGKKDSYHYALFGHALGLAKWFFQNGSLLGISVGVPSAGTATITTSTPLGLVAYDPTKASNPNNSRVTITGAITSFNVNGTYVTLNGTYYVQSVSSSTTPPYSFTIDTNLPAFSYTKNTDPNLSVTPGQTGSGSGYSDIGGADSAIALGLWGADGQTVPAQAGTFMHELGHANGLTHGGLFYDTPGSYLPTLEANCKPNFQSVMNYLFSVDLLKTVDSTGATVSALDYSEQDLTNLDESLLTGMGVTTTDGSPTTFLTSKWYALTPPNGVGGSPAKRYCNGAPLPTVNPPTMYRVEAPTTSILWSLTDLDANAHLDINFDGTIETAATSPPYGLRGYNDWTHIDLRQIGATGSLSVVGGGNLAGNGGNLAGNGGNLAGNGGNLAGNGGNLAGNGGNLAGNGGGTDTEITYEDANSVTRSPTNVTAAAIMSTFPHYVQVSGTPPSFGQIGTYNVYRSSDNGLTWKTITCSPLTISSTSFTCNDQSVSCGPTYRYFATAVLAGTNQESTASNTYPPLSQPALTACAPPYQFTGFLAPLQTASGTSYSGTFLIGNNVPTLWTLQNSSGYVSNLAVNTLLAIGPVPLVNGACPTPGSVPVFFNYTGTYPYAVSTLYSLGATLTGSTFGFNTNNNQFTFSWGTKAFAAGCYVIELDLDSGQVERTALKLAAPYIFTGFGPPLAPADSPPTTGSYSGKFNIGKSVTVKWELQTSNGTIVSNLSASTLLAVGPITVPSSGKCPDSLFPVYYRYSGSYPYPVQTLYSPTTGAKGNSTFRFSSPQFVFNWDTSTLTPGCYTIELDLDTGQVERTGLQF